MQAKRISYLAKKTVNKASADDNHKELFDEMLNHVKPLLILRGGCGKLEIKLHFRNLKVPVIEAFITEAVKRGIIQEVKPDTFKLTVKQ